ncbi:hypothetical protein [Mycobacterium sp. ITM-2016-00318]|uniref:hypothetical protein n=1 Tax=Mycobacterium sp. ITM-2016-00318 TaxID=2099693 RepID=UPI00287FAF22|nr:hypothetical protein [Mycobacterium sp. ITM-2016-00318]WNG90822.1 hypothetical protein C6A82_014840 [Mycobacterium sp. ITM-2016-00318]
MRKSDRVKTLSAAGGMLAAFAALTVAAPIAHADPALPPPPDPALPAPALPGPPLQPGPEQEQSISTQAAADDPALPAPPPAEVPHLLSPENLPPGTSDVPVEPPQSRGASYLRDLWHAVQTQDISGRDALLLLTQRPLDANAMPTNGLPAGPQAPAAIPQGEPLAPPPDAAPPEPVLPGSPSPPPGPALPEAPPPAP